MLGKAGLECTLLLAVRLPLMYVFLVLQLLGLYHLEQPLPKIFMQYHDLGQVGLVLLQLLRKQFGGLVELLQFLLQLGSRPWRKTLDSFLAGQGVLLYQGCFLAFGCPVPFEQLTEDNCRAKCQGNIQVG